MGKLWVIPQALVSLWVLWKESSENIHGPYMAMLRYSLFYTLPIILPTKSNWGEGWAQIYQTDAQHTAVLSSMAHPRATCHQNCPASTNSHLAVVSMLEDHNDHDLLKLSPTLSWRKKKMGLAKGKKGNFPQESFQFKFWLDLYRSQVKT